MTIPDKLPPLVDQVCTPEQSRELWELGVRAMGLYEWTVYESGEEITLKDRVMYSNFGEPVRYVGTYQAYTSAELGAMLGCECANISFPKDIGDSFRFSCRAKNGDLRTLKFPTEAQARAGLRIYLLTGGQP